NSIDFGATMKSQPNIADVQLRANEYIAQHRDSFSKQGDAKGKERTITWVASVHSKQPELTTMLMNDLEEGKLFDIGRVGSEYSKFYHGVLCELAALALERRKLPPNPLCKYAAEVL